MIDSDKINEMVKYFGVYGFGNFDITREEILHIIRILESDNYKIELRNFYNELEKQRMG